MLKEAAPLALRVAVPRAVVPSRKVTVPVGVVLPDVGETIAVNVTLWPVLICVAEAVSEVVVATNALRDRDGNGCGHGAGIGGASSIGCGDRV